MTRPAGARSSRDGSGSPSNRTSPYGSSSITSRSRSSRKLDQLVPPLERQRPPARVLEGRDRVQERRLQCPRAPRDRGRRRPSGRRDLGAEPVEDLQRPVVCRRLDQNALVVAAQQVLPEEGETLERAVRDEDLLRLRRRAARPAAGGEAGSPRAARTAARRAPRAGGRRACTARSPRPAGSLGRELRGRTRSCGQSREEPGGDRGTRRRPRLQSARSSRAEAPERDPDAADSGVVRALDVARRVADRPRLSAGTPPARSRAIGSGRRDARHRSRTLPGPAGRTGARPSRSIRARAIGSGLPVMSTMRARSESSSSVSAAPGAACQWDVSDRPAARGSGRRRARTSAGARRRSARRPSRRPRAPVA